MAIRRSWSVFVCWVGSGCAALGLFGLAAWHPGPPSPGELEMRVDPVASYRVVGRFHLTGVEPGTEARVITFDASTSLVHLPLPAGSYALALAPDARLACPGDSVDGLDLALPDLEATAPDAAERHSEPTTYPVSARPQIITIASGELTSVRVGLGFDPAHADRHVRSDTSLPARLDPCVPTEGLAERALSRR